LSEDLGIPPESVWECAVERITHPPGVLHSLIISDIPEIFAEFRGKQFSFLWRSSRDVFGASKFHVRCDGHGSTLIVILDTKENIFGGFTPVEWELLMWNKKAGNENNTFKTDENQKSFIFTLKNPHNIPAKRFALKAEMKQKAIYCQSRCGPCVGHGHDIGVWDNCNANTESYTYFDQSYTNDTGLDRFIVFTGSKYFQVKEIEVFEILLVYLGVSERYRLNNHLFRVTTVVCVLYYFVESAARRCTSTAPITFQTRYFSLSSLLQSSIDTHRIPSQKLISLITSTLLPVGKFQFWI
jgi:hypothetical protein